MLSSDEEEIKSDDEVSLPDASPPPASNRVAVDAIGVPMNVKHYREGKAPAWEYIKTLEQPHFRGAKRFTHVCTLCSTRIARLKGTEDAWRAALVNASTTSNAKKHLVNVHKTHPFALALCNTKTAKSARNLRVYDNQRSDPSVKDLEPPSMPVARPQPTNAVAVDQTSAVPGFFAKESRLQQSSIITSMRLAQCDSVAIATSRWLTKNGTVYYVPIQNTTT